MCLRLGVGGADIGARNTSVMAQVPSADEITQGGWVVLREGVWVAQPICDGTGQLF